MELRAARVAPPQIKNFEDYRQFLFEFHVYKKQTVRGWSYRLFSQRSGIQSPNYLQLVMKGQRNLSESMAENVAKAMSLSKNETRYFVALVQVSNSRSQKEELAAQKEVLRALRALVTSEISLAQGDILDDWSFPVVRELVALRDFEGHPQWIFEKTQGRISLKQAEKALVVLQKAGMIELDPSGQWRSKDPVLDTEAQNFQRKKINGYHKKTLKAFSEMIEDLPVEKRELGLMTISMDAKKIPEMKKRIQDFQDEIIGWLGEEKHPDTVVELGTYLLPITK